MINWEGLQKVNINKEREYCRSCGTNLSNMTYDNEAKSGPRISREELCKCHCGVNFIVRYDLFDKDGHVYSQVFSGDINNPAYNWHDILNEEQKKEISTHLESCQICKDRLSEKILDDAWFSSLMNRYRNKNQ